MHCNNNKFREQIRLFRRGGGPVLVEFEQAIGGRRLFVVEKRQHTRCLRQDGNIVEGFEHLFDRVHPFHIQQRADDAILSKGKIESKHLFHLHKGGTTRSLFFQIGNLCKIFSFPKWRSYILRTMYVLQSLQLSRYLVALQKMQEYAREIEKNFRICTKDWKDFVERKFEPHSFRKRWENIVCPYCENFCKNIHHSFVCASTPACRRDTNKKIAFGMEARKWFVGRKTNSRVHPANHTDPGEVRCTLSLERIPIRRVLVFY